MKTITYDENEWQLVPKVSTSAMDRAGENAYEERGHCDCGNAAGCSMELVYSSMLAVAPAAQDSAPAELPQSSHTERSIRTWRERCSTYAIQHMTSETREAIAAEIADLRAALAAAPASPQPVAKVLSDEQIEEIWQAAMLPTPDAEFELRSYAKEQRARFARAILAASTPTTLTEKKE